MVKPKFTAEQTKFLDFVQGQGGIVPVKSLNTKERAMLTDLESKGIVRVTTDEDKVFITTLGRGIMLSGK